MAASTELALRLSDSNEYNTSRGTDLILILTGEWLDHNKRHGDLTSAELRVKQACWEWFSQLSPNALERVSLILYFSSEFIFQHYLTLSLFFLLRHSFLSFSSYPFLLLLTFFPFFLDLNCG
jgi:hypothetical protein